jgi:hypothetical protein
MSAGLLLAVSVTALAVLVAPRLGSHAPVSSALPSRELDEARAPGDEGIPIAPQADARVAASAQPVEKPPFAVPGIGDTESASRPPEGQGWYEDSYRARMLSEHLAAFHGAKTTSERRDAGRRLMLLSLATILDKSSRYLPVPQGKHRLPEEPGYNFFGSAERYYRFRVGEFPEFDLYQSIGLRSDTDPALADAKWQEFFTWVEYRAEDALALVR